MMISVPSPIIVTSSGSQTFPVSITTDASDLISGVDLVLMINHSDYHNSGPLAPFITDIDMTGPGTLFSTVPSTRFSFNSSYEPFGQGGTGLNTITSVAADAVSGPDASVLADGVLAFVTVSAVGIPLGNYPIQLDDDNQLYGPTVVGPAPNSPETNSVMPQSEGQFQLGVDLFLSGGTIEVVPAPEPSSLVMGFWAAATLFCVLMRKRRTG